MLSDKKDMPLCDGEQDGEFLQVLCNFGEGLDRLIGSQGGDQGKVDRRELGGHELQAS